MSGDQALLDLPGPRISRVTIARLHNLGNYEHVRYEVTVELPPGTSPASVLHRTEQLLNRLDPKAPHSAYEVLLAQRLLSKPEPGLADFDDGRDHYETPEQRLASALLERENARKLLQRYDEWRKRRDAAHLAFDELGGSRVFTDAKDGWDDE